MPIWRGVDVAGAALRDHGLAPCQDGCSRPLSVSDRGMDDRGMPLEVRPQLRSDLGQTDAVAFAWARVLVAIMAI